MNEIRTLFENFWICKDTDKETYYKVKRDIHELSEICPGSAWLETDPYGKSY